MTKKEDSEVKYIASGNFIMAVEKAPQAEFGPKMPLQPFWLNCEKYAKVHLAKFVRFMYVHSNVTGRIKSSDVPENTFVPKKAQAATHHTSLIKTDADKLIDKWTSRQNHRECQLLNGISTNYCQFIGVHSTITDMTTITALLVFSVHFH